MLGIPDVFVCKTGNDEYGDGTETNPFATIGRALRGRPTGDMVRLFVKDLQDGETPQFEVDRCPHLHVFLNTWRETEAYIGDLYVRQPGADTYSAPSARPHPSLQAPPEFFE